MPFALPPSGLKTSENKQMKQSPDNRMKNTKPGILSVSFSTDKTI
jgi:hypothetical protein